MVSERTESGRLDARERWMLVGLFVLALLPRAWDFSSLGLDHFDEGGYAVTAQALANGNADEQFPLQHFLAPPVYYGLAALGMRVAGSDSDAPLFLLNILLGALTAPAIFLLARRAAGAPAAAAAGVLVAGSSLHVLFSRAALTDVAFALFFIIALGALASAERRRSAGRAVVAGLCIGLAWNTKYHGWLAVPIFGLACLPAFLRASTAERKGTVLRLALAGVVAALCFLPWFLHVQSLPGGYARLAQEHTSFLDGLPGYLERALLHVDAGQYLETGMGLAAWPLALLAAGWLAGGGRRALLAAVCAGLPLALAASWIGSPTLIGLLAVAALLHALVTRSALDPLLVTFAVVFALLVPLYHFYARLALPALLGGALLAGCVLGTCSASFELRRQGFVGLVLAALLLGAHTLLSPRDTAPAFFEKSGLAVASAELSSATSGDEPIAVLGEPALVFYLRGQGRIARHLNEPADLTSRFESGTEVQLVVGRYARWTGEWDAWRAEHAAGLKARARIPAQVGDVRLLDDARPWEARRVRAAPVGLYDLEVFEVVVP